MLQELDTGASTVGGPSRGLRPSGAVGALPHRTMTNRVASEATGRQRNNLLRIFHRHDDHPLAEPVVVA